jgi:hypothetical protein
MLLGGKMHYRGKKCGCNAISFAQFSSVFIAHILLYLVCHILVCHILACCILCVPHFGVPHFGVPHFGVPHFCSVHWNAFQTAVDYLCK